jgi:colicin import membrane protein
MESSTDKLRSLGLSLGVHLLCIAIMYAGLLWPRESTKLSVAGSPVEAVLMSAPASWKPAAPMQDEPEPVAPKPQPKEAPRPEQAETPPQPQPQAPIQRPDTRDTERAAQLAQQQAEERAKQEEIERKRQAQVLLDEQQKKDAERKQRLREQQLEREKELAEIRKLREDAERKRKLEEEKLKQLADRNPRPSEQPPKPDAPPADKLGNQGTDDSLAGRYKLAITQAVQSNWLRPETAQPGIRCVIRIVQIPGGEVIQASVSSPCNADDLTRRSIEAAVLKAQPLPYRGYESVFERDVQFTFHYDGD